MTPTKTVVTGVGIFALFCMVFAGCAFIDQTVDLSYERTVNARGGTGEIFIAKPKEFHGLAKKSNGWIVGTIKNGFGQHTADVTTETNPGDWFVGALVQELSVAGYITKTVSTLPNNVSKGLDLTISKVYVYEILRSIRVGGAGALSDVQCTVEIWKNGMKVKALNIAAKGDQPITDNLAESKGISFRKAMQAAMQQAVPEIIKTLEQ